jgi:iron-sulfur cluster repair protein YtfE (RIC family)
MAESITTMMTGEHRRMEGALGEAGRLLAAGLVAEGRSVVDRLDAEMRLHLQAEQELLFPVFEARAGIAGPVAVMRREHRAIEALLESVLMALDRKEVASAQDRLRRLAVLLTDHHLKEERILYPKTDQVLTPSERAGLTAQLRRS